MIFLATVGVDGKADVRKWVLQFAAAARRGGSRNQLLPSVFLIDPL